MQEKTDRVNQLSIINEELERMLKEKEESNESLSNLAHELEEKLSTSENRLKLDCDKVCDLDYLPFVLIKWSHIYTLFILLKKTLQLQEDVNHLLQSNKSHTDLINELREKLNAAESKLKKEFDLVDNWTLEKEVSLTEIVIRIIFNRAPKKSKTNFDLIIYFFYLKLIKFHLKNVYEL